MADIRSTALIGAATLRKSSAARFQSVAVPAANRLLPEQSMRDCATSVGIKSHQAASKYLANSAARSATQCRLKVGVFALWLAALLLPTLAEHSDDLNFNPRCKQSAHANVSTQARNACVVGSLSFAPCIGAQRGNAGETLPPAKAIKNCIAASCAPGSIGGRSMKIHNGERCVPCEWCRL